MREMRETREIKETVMHFLHDTVIRARAGRNQFLLLLPVAVLLWITVLPTEPRWSRGDMYLSVLTLGICLTGGMWCLVKRKAVRGSALDIAVMLWAAYFLIRFYTDGTYPCATLAYHVCQAVLLYVALRWLFTAGRADGRMLMAGLLLCAAYESCLGIGQCLSGHSRHYLFLITGTFQNPGPYSAYPALGLVLAASRLRSAKNRAERWCLYAAMSLCLVVLPATWSRAAVLTAGVICLWLYRKSFHRFRFVVWGGLIAAAVLCYFLKRGSADGRLLTWAAVLVSWWRKPLWGWGIGGFPDACASGVADLYGKDPDSGLFASGGVAEYAFNDLLQVLVEQGAVGAVLCLAVAGMMLFRLFRACRPLFWGMAGLLLFSLFSYPFELLPYRTVAVLVLAWAASVREQGQADRPGWRAALALGVRMMPVLFFSVLLMKGTKARTEADRECRLFSGMEEEVFLKDYYEMLPSQLDNARFLFSFGKTLQKAGRYNDSNAMLARGALVSADPMFHILRGNNFRDMGHHDLAEEAYGRAFATMPNRLYPLYRLMMMYEETGDTARCRRYAALVRDFREKVPSSATREMKEKADSIMTNGKGNGKGQ